MAESEEDRHLKLAGEFDCVPEPLPTLRHSTSHVMAQAVKQLFPEVRVAIGPAIEDGFYYDFAKPAPFTPEELEKIEARMREIVKKDLPFVREEWPREQAIRWFEEHGEPFKVEILRGLDVPTVSVLQAGRFPRPLPRAARGLHRRDQGLQAPLLLGRLLARGREEPDAPAHLRDGLAHAGGAGQASLAARRGEEARPPQARTRAGSLRLLRRRPRRAASGCRAAWSSCASCERFARESLDARGYQEIATPLLVNKKLWVQSGHWDLYQDNMFKLDVEGEIFSLKPMNCPESTYVYKRTLRSYRDLPIRYSEMGRCHRNERSGTLSGLVRVRQFTQDDAHIYCRPEQLQAEITGSPRPRPRVVRRLRAPALVPAGHAAARQARHRAAVGRRRGRAPPGDAVERPHLRPR